MDSSVLHTVDERGVATVTLNRPEVNNAYDAGLVDGVLATMDALSRIEGLRVVVIEGAGRHFQAGADLAWLHRVSTQSPADNRHASEITARLVHRLDSLPLPTVALVQGACFGGGTGIVAACDVAIATETAQFSIAETRWGLMAGIIVPQLADAIGVRQLRRYALTGERFDAHEARRIGLVHEVVPAAALRATGARVVEHLLQNAPEANAQTKALVREFAWGDVSYATFDRLVEQHAAKRQSAEAKEGLASFREKRAATWYPGPPKIET